MGRNFGLMGQWNDRRHEQNGARKLGGVGLAKVKGRLQVVAPFHEEFRAWAKRNGGRWRYKAEFWSFPWADRLHIYRQLEQCYSVTVESDPSEVTQWMTPRD